MFFNPAQQSKTEGTSASHITPASSPVRATAGSAKASRRFLWGVVSKFKHSELIWHIITSVPNLEIIVNKFNQLKSVLEELEDYEDMVETIQNALYGSRGVYYTVTSRDALRLKYFALHIAHTVLYEVENQTRVQNADHQTKAYSMTININNIIVNLNIANQSVDAADQKQIINEFIDYLTWHLTAIRSVLAYAKFEPPAASSKRKSTSKYARSEVKREPAEDMLAPSVEVIYDFHPTKPAGLTPSKFDTPARETIINRRKVGCKSELRTAASEAAAHAAESNLPPAVLDTSASANFFDPDEENLYHNPMVDPKVNEDIGIDIDLGYWNQAMSIGAKDPEPKHKKKKGLTL
jgi:hypothetical protein